MIRWLGSLRSDMMKTLGKIGSGELEGEVGEGLEVTDDNRACLLPRNWVRAVLGLPNLGSNKGAMRYTREWWEGQTQDREADHCACSVTSIQEVPEAGELASTARSCQQGWLQAGIQSASHHARASEILTDRFITSGHKEMSPPSFYGRPLL